MDPDLTPLAQGMTGGAKKKRTGKKGTKKGAKKSGGAEAKKCGGSFLSNLGQLAIPLGLIAAKEGVEALNKNSKKASSSKKSTKKSTKKSVARRASFGGNPEALVDSSPSPYPSSVSDASPPVMPVMPVMNTSSSTAPATSSSEQMGGAERSTAIAQEFRRMASEISKFMSERKAAAIAESKAKKAKKAKAPQKKK